MRNLRIFIAEPDRDLRIGLEMLLDLESGIQVVGIAIRPEGLERQVAAVLPDILLIDWQLVVSMPEGYIMNLHSLEPPPIIIVLHVRPETHENAETVNADYFFSKDSPPDKLLMCLRKLKEERITKNNSK